MSFLFSFWTTDDLELLRRYSNSIYVPYLSCSSARCYCGPHGHPPRLSLWSGCGLHRPWPTHSWSRVVCLQKHQKVSTQPPPVLSTCYFPIKTKPLSPCFCSCANDTSSWVPLPPNSTDVTMDAHLDEENNLESQVLFGHLENTLAVRCLAKNDMAAVSREVKLVSNGKDRVVVINNKLYHVDKLLRWFSSSVLVFFPWQTIYAIVKASTKNNFQLCYTSFNLFTCYSFREVLAIFFLVYGWVGTETIFMAGFHKMPIVCTEYIVSVTNLNNKLY